MHERLLAKLRGSGKLFADETTAPLLDPGRGRTKKGQLWAEPARGSARRSRVELQAEGHVRREFVDFAAKGTSPTSRF